MKEESEKLCWILKDCSARLELAFKNNASMNDVFNIVDEVSITSWKATPHCNLSSPVVLALRSERWDVMASLIKKGHYYIEVFGVNFKMLTGIITSLPDGNDKSNLLSALKCRANKDFLNWIS